MALLGQRLDEVDPAWCLHAERYWDPPLAAEGFRQAASSADTLSQYDISRVVVSPYRRCLQTAAPIVGSLQPHLRACELDPAFGEVLLLGKFMNGRGLKPTDTDTSKWLWAGQDISAMWGEAINSTEQVMAGGQHEWHKITTSVATSPHPEFPETLEQAHVRYSEALCAALERSGAKNVLIVTHGEAVHRALRLCVPWAVVYAVGHCGFVVLSREAAIGEAGEWQLCAVSDVHYYEPASAQ